MSVFYTNGQFSNIIGKGQLVWSHDVTVNTNNQIFIADFSHHCIYAFTLGDDYVTKFAEQGSGTGKLSMPYGVTEIYMASH